jgi:hypothetical protein
MRLDYQDLDLLCRVKAVELFQPVNNDAPTRAFKIGKAQTLVEKAIGGHTQVRAENDSLSRADLAELRETGVIRPDLSQSDMVSLSCGGAPRLRVREVNLVGPLRKRGIRGRAKRQYDQNC